MSSAIEETTLPGDLPGVKLTSPKGTAEVYRHGAHVTSWKTETGEELIFLSTDVRARSNAPPPRFRQPPGARGAGGSCAHNDDRSMFDFRHGITWFLSRFQQASRP